MAKWHLVVVVDSRCSLQRRDLRLTWVGAEPMERKNKTPKHLILVFGFNLRRIDQATFQLAMSTQLATMATLFSSLRRPPAWKAVSKRERRRYLLEHLKMCVELIIITRGTEVLTTYKGQMINLKLPISSGGSSPRCFQNKTYNLTSPNASPVPPRQPCVPSRRAVEQLTNN